MFLIQQFDPELIDLHVEKFEYLEYVSSLLV